MTKGFTMTDAAVDYSTYTIGHLLAIKMTMDNPFRENGGSVRNLNRDYQDGLPEAFNRITASNRDLTDDTLASVDNYALGDALITALYLVVRQRPSLARSSIEQIGNWIRDNVALAREFDPEAFPMPEYTVGGHQVEARYLRDWACNDEETFVAEGVDAMADWLQGRTPRAWPNDGCQSIADAKDYLSLVMRYKRARLARRAAADAMQEVAPVVEEPPTAAPMDGVTAAQINALESRIRIQADRIRALVEDLGRAQQNHADDIEKIGTALIREAQQREWCNEYDTFVERLNGNLHQPLEVREQEFTVSWTETYTLTVHRSTTVTASDGDAAVEQVRDSEDEVGAADNNDLREAIRQHDYSFDDNTDDWDYSEN